MSNQKGITLVALILIIILLVIIAGLSIAIMIQNEDTSAVLSSDSNSIIEYNPDAFDTAYDEYENSISSEENTTIEENTESEITNEQTEETTEVTNEVNTNTTNEENA